MLPRVIRTTRIATTSTFVAATARPSLASCRFAPRAAHSGSFPPAALRPSAATTTTPAMYSTSASESQPTATPTSSQGRGETSPTSNDQPQDEEAAVRLDRALPAPVEGSDDAIKLDVSGGGSTVKLDSLGPLVVHQDGTVSRIKNWPHMTEIERENTLRVLGKRNQSRLAALRAQGQGLNMNGGQESQSD